MRAGCGRIDHMMLASALSGGFADRRLWRIYEPRRSRAGRIAALGLRRNADEIMGYLSDDAVWDNVAIRAFHGQREIRRRCAGIPGPDDSRSKMEIVNLAVAGNVVLTERVDHFYYDGRIIPARVMGAFEADGNKITSWRDYFDVPNTPST